MCGGSDSPPVDTYAQDRQIALMRQLEADWGHRFKPIEEGLVNEIMNRDSVIRRNVYESGKAAKASYDATKDMAERNMANYGTQMDKDQQEAMERSDAMAGQGAVISARNMARDSSISRLEQQQGGMVSLGRGVQQLGISGFNQAAAMEAARNNQNQQIYGQHQANGWNTLGGIAGMAGMMMMSDRDSKTNVKPASTRKALKDIDSIDIKRWDYKPGMSGGRTEKGHIGGMAQDMPDSMTSDDKKQVDIGDSLMTAIGAVQELSKKVNKLEKNHGGK